LTLTSNTNILKYRIQSYNKPTYCEKIQESVLMRSVN